MSKNLSSFFSKKTQSVIAWLLLMVKHLFLKLKQVPSHSYVIVIICVLIFYSCTDQYSQGKRIYATLCSNCHGDDGNGLKKLIPSIVTGKTMADPQKLVCTIKNGINPDSLDTKLSIMPAHKKLKAAELTNLINYMNSAFRKEHKYYKISEVESWMLSCK